MEKNGAFSLFETSVNGNVTFTNIMTFLCTSVYNWPESSASRVNFIESMLIFDILCYYGIISPPGHFHQLDQRIDLISAHGHFFKWLFFGTFSPPKRQPSLVVLWPKYLVLTEQLSEYIFKK